MAREAILFCDTRDDRRIRRQTLCALSVRDPRLDNFDDVEPETPDYLRDFIAESRARNVIGNTVGALIAHLEEEELTKLSRVKRKQLSCREHAHMTPDQKRTHAHLNLALMARRNRRLRKRATLLVVASMLVA